MTHQPDEDRDVIIHCIQETDGTTGAKRDRWTLFVGQTEAGEETSPEQAPPKGGVLSAACLPDTSGQSSGQLVRTP
jgi:hypothetical protein